MGQESGARRRCGLRRKPAETVGIPGFIVFAPSSAYITGTWFYVPSDEALLLRRPARQARRTGRKTSQSLTVRFLTSGMRMSRVAALQAVKEMQ
jgi:hypothetical protein